MPDPRAATRILDEEFLTLRAKALELAAGLDRLDRAEGDVSRDARRDGLSQAVQILLSDQPNRAERVQLLFSREYQADWPSRLEVSLAGEK